MPEDMALNPTQDHVAKPSAGPNEAGFLPRQVGRYLVLEKLGAGGMGVVYRAYDPELQRHVAVKLPNFTGPSEAQRLASERFLREARAAARVRHPHLCPIHDVGEVEGRPFVVMDFVDGQSLHERLKQGPFPDPRQPVQMVCQVAQALHAVHQHGIVHRDLKPGNILLDKDGQPFLTDFGLARMPEEEKLTAEGVVPGTPAYMAPEQIDPAAFGQVGPHTDVYSLGVVLYEMLAGHTPFTGSLSSLFRQITTVEPPPLHSVRPDLSPSLVVLVQRSMARRPADRFASAVELAEALTAWLTQPVAGEAGAVPSPFPRRIWLLAGSLAGAVLLLLLWAGIHLGWFDSSGSSLSGTNNHVPVPESLQSTLTERIWKKGATDRALTFRDPGVLPLQAGDYLRFEAQLNRPGYVYLVYLESSGEAVPYYPWEKYDWQRRRPEKPVTRLAVPEDPLKDAAPLIDSPSGIEAILMLVRDEPLTPAENETLVQLLANRPRPTKVDLLRGAVWFSERGLDSFTNLLDRGRISEEKSIVADDPVEEIRRLVQTSLRPLFKTSRAVCFPFQGQKK